MSRAAKALPVSAVLFGGLLAALVLRQPEENQAPRSESAELVERARKTAVGPGGRDDHRDPPPGTISGRVLARGGTPIAGVQVSAFQDLGPRDADLEDLLRRVVDLEEISKMAHPEATTGAGGRYVIGGLENYWYTVRATAHGYTPSEIENVLAPKDGVDLVLEEGSVLEGLVQDTAGRPVGGAVVQAYPELEGAGIFTVILSKARPPVDEAKSDSRGYFRLDRLGGGLCNFLVETPAYQDLTEMNYQINPGANRTKNFTLTPGHVIRGVVRGPDDEPVSGAGVRARPSRDDQRPDPVRFRFEDGSVATDEQGTFLFDTLPESDFTLLVWHADYQSAQFENVRPSAKKIILRLSSGNRLFGIVVDAGNGNPVPGTVVSVSDLAGVRKEGVTDERGMYAVPGLGGRQSVSVLVRAPGYAGAKQRLELRDSRELELDFKLPGGTDNEDPPVRRFRVVYRRET